MFGAKYSRMKFWIISICLLIPFTISSVLMKALETSESNQNGYLGFWFLNILVITIWINTLSNRMRDYGSNPWFSLLALIPLGNIIMALYYGIVQYKKKENSINENKNISNKTTSLTKAVVNHAKETACNIKPIVNEYVEKHSSHNCKEENQEQTFNKLEIANDTISFLNNEDIESMTENEIYEKVMLEIEEDKKVKSTWAKVFSQTNGDINKSQALYIKNRVNDIKISENNRIKEEQEKAEIKRQKDLDYTLNTERGRQEEIIRKQNNMLKSMNFTETKKDIVEFYTNIGYFIKLDKENSMMMKHNTNQKSYIQLILNEGKQEFKLDLFNVIYSQSQAPYSNTLLFKSE